MRRQHRGNGHFQAPGAHDLPLAALCVVLQNALIAFEDAPSAGRGTGGRISKTLQPGSFSK